MFMHPLFDIFYDKDSAMPQLQFSYAPEKHGLRHPAASVLYQIAQYEYIAIDPF